MMRRHICGLPSRCVSMKERSPETVNFAGCGQTAPIVDIVVAARYYGLSLPSTSRPDEFRLMKPWRHELHEGPTAGRLTFRSSRRLWVDASVAVFVLFLVRRSSVGIQALMHGLPAASADSVPDSEPIILETRDIHADINYGTDSASRVVKILRAGTHTQPNTTARPDEDRLPSTSAASDDLAQGRIAKNHSTCHFHLSFPRVDVRLRPPTRRFRCLPQYCPDQSVGNVRHDRG